MVKIWCLGTPKLVLVKVYKYFPYYDFFKISLFSVQFSKFSKFSKSIRYIIVLIFRVGWGCCFLWGWWYQKSHYFVSYPYIFCQKWIPEPQIPLIWHIGHQHQPETAEKELLDKNSEIWTSVQIITMLCIAVTQPGTGFNWMTLLRTIQTVIIQPPPASQHKTCFY